MKEFDFNTTPIVDIVNNIIIDAVKKNASDIHFDPAENYLKIRFRVDGDLSDYSIIENKYKRNLITRVKLIAGMNITETRLPQDGAIKGVINGKDLDMRVSALPASFGEKIVIRILDYTMSMQGLETLGFTEENYNLITKMLENPNGIILITGATGSGKSTTVYSMLQKLNKEETNIITVEDPVEMNIEGINQVQVNAEIGLDFASVLRSILRQDPNIILIGEIRDNETAKIAIRSSITGHLVLSTLHTNNSLTTIERLLDMDVERYLLSSSLKGIISQTLAKRLCPNCRKQRATTATEKRIFQKVFNINVDNIYDAVGCKECHKGYRGRIALQEVLLINDEIRDAINDEVPRSELRNLIYNKKNVKTLLQDGLIKVLDGTTSLKEVLRLVDIDENSEELYGKKDINETKNNISQNMFKPSNNYSSDLNNFINDNKNDDIIINTFANNNDLNKLINNNINLNNEIINKFSNNNKDENNIINNNNNIKPTNDNFIYNNEKNNFNKINLDDIIKPKNNHSEINEFIKPILNQNEEIELNPIFENPIKQQDTKETTLEDTQDIFKLYKELENKTNKENKNEETNIKNSSNYTNDLINLINQGFFE